MRQGMTLIETLLYLALLGLLMSGAVVAAYNVLGWSAQAQTRAMLQEEDSFILGKIEWSIFNASAVGTPPAHGAGTILSVVMHDGTITSIRLTGMVLYIDTGHGPQALTDPDVRVTRLLFSHTFSSGVGVDPEAVQCSFDIETTAPNGMVVSEHVPTTTVSLRN